jgi:hypothetical protein
MANNNSINLYDFIGLACGTNLTKTEAKELACAINLWLKKASVGNAVALWGERDQSMTLQMLKKYMSKNDSPFTVPSNVLAGDRPIQAANQRAREHFSRGTFHMYSTASYTHPGVIFTSGDLKTAVGRIRVEYSLDVAYVPTGPNAGSHPGIRGRLVDERYTFLDTGEEKVNAILPYFSLESLVCCWKCGSDLSDQWMADLERFDHAKSFDVYGTWIFIR